MCSGYASNICKQKATNMYVRTIHVRQNYNIPLTYVLWWYFPVGIDDVWCVETDLLDFLYSRETWYTIVRHTVGLRWCFTTFGFLKLYFWNQSTFCKLDIPLQAFIKIKHTININIYPIVTWLNINIITIPWTHYSFFFTF